MRSTLYLIDGASGTGKSDLLEYVRGDSINAGVLIKTTTRTLRDFEISNGVPLDLTFCSPDAFARSAFDYHYEHRGYQYGFNRSQLAGLLSQHSNVFAIIRNIALLRRLKDEFREFHAVAVFVQTTVSEIVARLTRQHLTNADIRYRVETITQTLADYRHNTTAFDEVLVNDSDRDTYHHRIGTLIAKYTSMYPSEVSQ